MNYLRYNTKKQVGKWERGAGEYPPTDRMEARSGGVMDVGVAAESRGGQLGGPFLVKEVHLGGPNG